MDSGIVYPEITLAGVRYQGKVTRGSLAYRISKLGLNPSEMTKRYSVMIDTLHALLTPSFPGSPEDLAEIVDREQKRGEALKVVAEALVKVFPPSPAQTTAGDQPAPSIQ